MALVLGLVGWVGVREWVCANILVEQRQAFFWLRIETYNRGTGVILVGDSSFVLPLYFYSNEDDRRRIFFPIDFDAIHRLESDDSGEENLWAGRDGVFPFRIFALGPGAKLRRGEVLVARPDGWLAKSVWPTDFELHTVRDELDWGRIGGVFTPMGHEETRIFESQR